MTAVGQMEGQAQDPLPKVALVLVAVFSSSCMPGLWSLPCLDSSKRLIFEMSFLFYYSIPSKLDQAGKHNTKAQSVCEMKLMAPSCSHLFALQLPLNICPVVYSE